MALIDKLTNIANEIRIFGEMEKKLSLSDMEVGVSQVHEKGIAVGYQRGLQDGREAEKAEFWENVPNGAQKYLFAGPGWNVHTFFPTKSFTFSGILTDNMFSLHGCASEPYDLAQRLQACGVTFDFSGITRANSMFYNSGFTGLPFLDFSGCSKLNNTFSYSKSLCTIAELKLGENVDFDKAFQQCTALENITVSGCIGQSGLDFSDCPLSRESLLSVLSALKEGVSGKTVTLGESNLAKLTDSEKEIATGKGWTLQ